MENDVAILPTAFFEFSFLGADHGCEFTVVGGELNIL